MLASKRSTWSGAFGYFVLELTICYFLCEQYMPARNSQLMLVLWQLETFSLHQRNEFHHNRSIWTNGPRFISRQLIFQHPQLRPRALEARENGTFNWTEANLKRAHSQVIWLCRGSAGTSIAFAQTFQFDRFSFRYTSISSNFCFKSALCYSFEFVLYIIEGGVLAMALLCPYKRMIFLFV